MNNNEELLLREHIRKTISLFKKQKVLKEQQDEKKLRAIIRSLLIKEVSEDQPKHDSTGINVLEDLLKKVIPVIKADYSRITTSQNQRQSFRAHIINAVQNSLSPEIMYDKQEASAEQKIDIKEQKTKVSIEDPDKSKLIDIEDKPEEPEELSPQEEFARGLEDKGLDSTGRNLAMSTYKQVEKNIVDSYSLLDDMKDKDLFYDYLITNLKLYFDKFEDEMLNTVTEPTTDEYEQEKARKEQEDVAQPAEAEAQAEEEVAEQPVT